MHTAFKISRYCRHMDYVFLLKTFLKYTKLISLAFLRIKCVDVYTFINISEGRQPRLLYSEVFTCLSSFVQKVVQHMCGILLKFTRQASMIRTVVMRKMRPTCLYSIAGYRLYFEQYIDGYIINKHTNSQIHKQMLFAL